MKGIDPKTREIAKDLARRSGMTLGEWLTHVIAEDGPEEPPPLAARKAVDRPASENRTPRRGDDLDRVLETLQDLSTRFEASIQEQGEAAARFDRAIAELKADQTKVAERLQSAELSGGRDKDNAGKVETLRALEGALNKVAGHLAAGEGRQREALVLMRRELGEEMSRVADQVNRKVLEVENRGADAIAQVGAEVTRVATAVEQRLRRADDIQAEALEKLGGEIARITERLSERISASERRAAQAVEDVGAQVARMADRIHARQERSESELAERMRQSEERTIKLLEEARQTLDRRLLRAGVAAPEEAAAASAFSQRWKPAEIPMVEAVEPEPAAEPEVHEAYLEFEAPEAEAAPIEAAPVEDGPVDSWAVQAEAIEEQEVDAEAILEAVHQDLALEAEEASHDDLPHADLPYDDLDEDGEPKSVGYEIYSPTLTADVGFGADLAAEDDAAALQAVADAIALEEGDEGHHEGDPEDGSFSHTVAFRALDEHGEPEESLRPSTRALIAEARAAAFADQSTSRVVEPEPDDDAGATFIDFNARKPRQSHSMRGALLAGGAAAFMGLAGAGYVAMHPEFMHGLGAAPAKPIPVGPPSAPATAPQAAVALATAPTPKPDSQDLDSLYRDAAAKVDSGDASGVAPLTTAANLGYAPAQQRLGKLYEDGAAGVEKDPVEGRRWTQRAAANGNARAMHNLGLDYYQGVGGIKNETVAAEWFRRAAELGLRDSQFNLALFYEKGVGIARDPSAAYRWYLIAGRGGDTEAVSRAGVLKEQLPAADRARAEAMANAFRADPSAPPASLAASLRGANRNQLTLAQRALAKLGYFKGAADGEPTEALGQAIQTYQRERGLADNGQLSPSLVQTFAHIVQ